MKDGEEGAESDHVVETAEICDQNGSRMEIAKGKDNEVKEVEEGAEYDKVAATAKNCDQHGSSVEIAQGSGNEVKEVGEDTETGHVAEPVEDDRIAAFRFVSFPGWCVSFPFCKIVSVFCDELW